VTPAIAQPGDAERDPLLHALLAFAPELQPMVAGRSDVSADRSSLASLRYAGTPHPWKHIKYVEGSRPEDYEDLVVKTPGSPTRVFRCRGVTMSGELDFEDVTFIVIGRYVPSDVSGAAGAPVDHNAVSGPDPRGPARR